MSLEANLSSHLTISYMAAPTASGTIAPASDAHVAGADASAGDGAAGFLAALVDQLLAGATGAPQENAGTAAGANANTGATVAAPFGIAIDPVAAAAADRSPQGNVLLTQLTRQLQALKEQLDSGEQADPDLLKKLGQTADALTALITTPVPLASPAIDPNATLDPLASIGQSTERPKIDPLAGLVDGSQQPAGPSTSPSDQVAQFLASLGITLPAPNSSSNAPAIGNGDTPATSATPLPGIAQLASGLADLSQAIAPAAPEIAQKLQALTQKLDAAETNPQLLAQLTGTADSDGTTLDKIVQSLLDARPGAPAAATAQISSTAQLQVPTPIAPNHQPQTPGIDDLGKIAAGPGTTATTSMTTKVTAASRQADAAPANDTSKPEAKVVAAIAAKVDAKSDAPDPAGQSAAAAPAPIAQAAARAVPAAYQAASNPINMGQVAFEMVRQMHQGISRFNIRIDPPELGRIDVKMHVDAAGNVSARLTVERSETLDMFQRDRGSLEKALSQAGLDSGKTNLEFSLKQNPFAGLAGDDQRPGNGNPPSRPFSLAANDGDDAVTAVPSVTLYRGIATSGGVNLFV